MASKRRTSVWDVLARLGHRGDRDGIIQHVFEATSRVTLESADGGTVEGGDFLVETFEALGTTKDWPPCGGREWTRLRVAAVRRIIARLAREGLLDAVAVGNDGGTTSREGTHHDARGAAEPEWSGDGDRGRDPGAPGPRLARAEAPERAVRRLVWRPPGDATLEGIRTDGGRPAGPARN